jgi:hypothetical protein
MRTRFWMLGLAAATCAAPAPAQSIDSAFRSLERAEESLAARSEREPEAVPAANLSALRSQIDLLKGAAQSLPPAERRDYARSLDAQSKVLAEAALEVDAARALAMVDEVAADLRIKAQSRPALGAANALRGHVRVTVRTRRNARDVPGLIVGANPVALRGANLLFRFEQESSPTSKLLPPGRYEFVLLRGEKILSRQRADVGIASSDAVNLDLAVPEETPPR